jgi:hypothetical protein
MATTLRDLRLIGRAIAIKDLQVTSMNPKEYNTRFVRELAEHYGIKGARGLLEPLTVATYVPVIYGIAPGQ